FILRSHHDDLWFFIENFRLHMLPGKRREDVRYHQIDFALLMSSIAHPCLSSQHMKDSARISPGQWVEDGGNKARSNDDSSYQRSPARRGVGEELYLLHALPQLVERHETTVEKCAPIECGLDTLRAAIEESDAERVFHIGNRLGYGGLRHGELR